MRKFKACQGMVSPGVIILLSLLIIMPTMAQSSNEYSVNWTASYPLKKGDQKASFSERVSRLVFGQKPEELIKPFNVVARDQDKFWILDQGSGAVFEVNEGKGAVIRSMEKSRLVFPSIVAICTSPGGDLLFTDSRLNRVFLSSGDQLQIFGEADTLKQPTGIACNRITGDVWVVETGAHQISRFNNEGKLIERIGGRGEAAGLYNYPTFIWIDASGHIYIVDSMNNRIQVLDSQGNFLGMFGESGDATGYLARPKGIATDKQGHIYVADALFHAVQVFNQKGEFLYSFGKQGQGDGEFWIPTGLFIDDQDHIYVADSYNARVQIFILEKKE